MESLLEDPALQAVLGRTDFVGLDNAALDFSQLEEYINEQSETNADNTPVSSSTHLATGNTNNNNNNNNTIVYFSEGLASGLEAEGLHFALHNNHQQQQQQQQHQQYLNNNFIPASEHNNNNSAQGVCRNSLKLPESPPDSEPPFSPPESEHQHNQHQQPHSTNENIGTTSTTNNMDNMKHFVDYGQHGAATVVTFSGLAPLPQQHQPQQHTLQVLHPHDSMAATMGTTGTNMINAHSMLEGVGGLLHHAASANMYAGDVYHHAHLVEANPAASVSHTTANSDQQQQHSMGVVYGLAHVDPTTTPTTPQLAQQQQQTILVTGANNNKKRKISEQTTTTSALCHNNNNNNKTSPSILNGGGTLATTTTTVVGASVFVKQEPLGSLSPDSALQVNGNNNSGPQVVGCSSSSNSSSNNSTRAPQGTATANSVHSTQQCGPEDYDFEYGPDSQMYDAFYQCIRFTPFNPTSCCTLYDASGKEVPTITYHVDADKGFNYSNADEAFVCQKKNHFQVTVHIQSYTTPVYVRPVGAAETLHKVDNFCLHFYGVKLESPTQTIKVEQSQSDRTKKAFHPVVVDVSAEHVTKLTMGRLHFSETTSNNMRKKGKPNPDQRYFNLVVALCAHVGDEVHQIAAQASERIIVRASNPGQFESDVELIWQKGTTSESIFHTGRVGINTDRPDEALVVFGNAKVTGNIMQPSDERAKTNIEEVDTREQLKNVSAMRIVRYEFKNDFAREVGLRAEERAGTGVLAQEVARIIPEAVKETGDIVLPSGETIENFLVVNKDRIFMENLGAVKELCKVTDNLEMRIDELEKMNTRLSKFNRFDSLKSASVLSRGSMVSSMAGSSRASGTSCYNGRHRHKQCPGGGKATARRDKEEPRTVCTNQFLQTIIMILVFIMAFCLASIATLYILEYHRRHHNLGPVYQQHSPPQSQQGSMTNYVYTHPNVNNIDYHQLHPSSPSTFYRTSPSSINYGNSIDVYKDHKKFDGQTSSMRNNGQQSQQWPAAIPILRPQVLGIPYGCLELGGGGGGGTATGSNCGIYCCIDETSNNFGQHEPVVLGGPVDGVNNTADQAEGSSSKSKQQQQQHVVSPSPSAPMVVITTRPSPPPPPPMVTGPGSDVVHKKKRTDKGLNLGKFGTSGGIQDIHGMGDFEDSKGTLMRRRRETGKTIDYNNKQTIDNLPRKDLTKVVEMIKLIELNATIDYSYCTRLQCTQGQGSRFHYIIPVSKFMDLEYVTLQLSLSQEMKVDHCEARSPQPTGCAAANGQYESLPPIYNKKEEVITGSNGQQHAPSAAHLMAESNPHWRLPIGIYLRSAYVFRILARHVDVDTPCNLADSQLGVSFIEYKFEFVRKCDK